MKTRTPNTFTNLSLTCRAISLASRRMLGSNRSKGSSSILRRFRPTIAVVAVIVALFLVSLFNTSNNGFPVGTHVGAFSEDINTFASNCSTPKTQWNLGETACAVATGAPDDRRIAWVAPDGTIARVSGFFSGTLNDSYTIPTGSSQFAQVGTWLVETIDVNGTVSSTAEFLVRDPNSASVDLSIGVYGPFEISAGSNINYRVELINRGPDPAQNVILTTSVPGGTTFVSETQDSGDPFTCGNPDANGIINCTIATLPANETAILTFSFAVDGNAPNGTSITSSASISSSTNELHAADNSASTTTTVVSATSSCTISCPSVAPISTSGCSAIVTYTTPTASGDCGASGAVVCSPPSGATFGIGSTTVTCTAETGDSCSFTVTVQTTSQGGPLSITCPANLTVNSDQVSAGTVPVAYPAPTTTGNCVTVTCAPASGSLFPLGTTTVTCTATDTSNAQPATCSFTVTVNNASGDNCTITCPGDVTQSASGNQCTAVVTYSPPTTSGPCGTVTCTPPSGSTFQVGVTVVTCTGAGSDCDFAVTVIAASVPTITTCATNKTVAANSACEGVIPNLLGEVSATGCNVTITQSPAAGSVVNPGVYTVTITAENTAGDATCTATVSVLESTPPVITTCPPASSATASASCQAAVPNVIGSVVATDNCTPAEELTVTQSPAAGALVGSGTTTITVTVKDASNNSATCTTSFTVIDTTPPTISCPPSITRNTDPGQCSAVVTYANATATDSCPGVETPVCVPASGSAFPKGNTAVTCTVSDAAHNSSSCSFIVTVNDVQPPAITCLSDIVVDFDPGVNGATVTYAAPVGTDNCPGAITTQITGLPSGATFPAGTTTNTFRVTDAGGLTAQCSFKVTVAVTSIIGLDSVSITGSAMVDSYDSTGGYPATKSSLANILSNGTITVSGSSRVYGNVRSTRAGVVVSGSSQVTGNATAGTTVSIIPSGSVGGTVTNSQLAPVMTLPSVPACGPPYSPNTGISGTYSYNPGTGDLSLSGVNIATLANGTYCFHNVTLTNSAQLKVNGPVVIKLTGTLSVGGATSLSNTTGIPANLRILSSYSGTTGVTLGNSINAQLVIYAPNTGVTISGAVPMFGTVVGKTVTISNSGMIHYDIQLKSIWPEIWSLIQ